MELVAFYHAYADGRWQEPLAEYLEALDAAEFRGSLFVGVVGADAEPVYEMLRSRPRTVIARSRSVGNESITLNHLRSRCQMWSDDYAILYAHTKGAYDNTPFRARWRQSMTFRVVASWRENLEWLASGDFDAIGCHWLTEAEFPGMFPPAMAVPANGSGFFGGNFWMATCSYLRTLPPCEPEPRWQAEQWIGINHPRVVDLLPGWPGDNRWRELCV